MKNPPETGVRIPCTRLPHESHKAYAAFRAYCELEPGRTLTKLSQIVNKNRTWLGTWSRRWQWQERLRTFEDEQEALRRECEAKAAQAAAEKRESRKGQLIEKLWVLQEKMAEKFMAMMEFPVSKTEVKVKNGKTTIITNPGSWRFNDAVRLAHGVQIIGAFATGMSKSLRDPDTAGDTQLPVNRVDMPKLVIEVVHHKVPGGEHSPLEKMKELTKGNGGGYFTRS